MELYFEPMACSLAARISIYAAGLDANFRQVDVVEKRVLDGRDFYAVNPMGQVPALITDEGQLLTENIAVLQYIAGKRPGAGLGASTPSELFLLLQWLGFISTELHKSVFAPIVDPAHNPAVVEYAQAKAERRFGYLNLHLAGRELLLRRFSIADAYLVTLLNWMRTAGLDINRWPHVKAYQKQVRSHPAVDRAFNEEIALYLKHMPKHGTARVETERQDQKSHR